MMRERLNFPTRVLMYSSGDIIFKTMDGKSIILTDKDKNTICSILHRLNDAIAKELEFSWMLSIDSVSAKFVQVRQYRGRTVIDFIETERSRPIKKFSIRPKHYFSLIKILDREKLVELIQKKML
jgi:hypothetical protein